MCKIHLPKPITYKYNVLEVFTDMVKKVLPLDQLKSGMVVSDNVVTKRGQTVATRGTVLNRSLINRLSFYKITAVEVETSIGEYDDDEPVNVQPEIAPASSAMQAEFPLFALEDSPSPSINAPEPEPTLAEMAASLLNELPKAKTPPPVQEEPKERRTVDEIMSYTQKMKSTPEYQGFQLDYSICMEKLRQTFSAIHSGQNEIDYNEILAQTNKLFASKTSLEMFGMIHTMRSIDDSVYAHSVNVALIAHAIGRWLKMSKEDLDQLTLAALLHDIGKMDIPEEVLNKQGALTDEEFQMIRNHPSAGNKMLRKIGARSIFCNVALQHHERFDGSGYPKGLDGDEIDDYAAIVAIADVYDAMTASRSYRAPKCAFQVIAAFEDEGFQKYHTKYIMTFLQRIAFLYQNATVMLSDGRTARVVYINQNKLSKPVVEDGNHEMIDLSRTSDLTITSIL